MKAIVYEGPGRVALEQKPVPRPLPGWTLVRVEYAGVCGSDMTIYSGKHPRATPPLILGHEFSGRVASPHPELAEGTLVSVYPHLGCGHCDACRRGLSYTCENLRIIGIDRDGGMAEYAAAPDDALYAAPEGISPRLAAFVEPISIGVHAARRGGYRPGDSVVLFGAGGIGLATALTLRHFGADRVLICEPQEERLALAREMGFDTLRSDGPEPGAEIARKIGPRGADFVFDCAGHPSVIDLMPDVVRIGGTIVVVAGYREPPAMNFQKGMFREFRVQFVRNSARDDFETALRLAAADPLYGRLPNCVLPPEQVSEGFHKPAGALKVLFDFRSEKEKN